MKRGINGKRARARLRRARRNKNPSKEVNDAKDRRNG